MGVESQIPVPANDIGDPFATVESSLSVLYWRRWELLRKDVAAMPPEQRLLRAKALQRFEAVETLLLAELRKPETSH